MRLNRIALANAAGEFAGTLIATVVDAGSVPDTRDALPQCCKARNARSVLRRAVLFRKTCDTALYGLVARRSRAWPADARKA
jgi:hypothetical protein